MCNLYSYALRNKIIVLTSAPTSRKLLTASKHHVAMEGLYQSRDSFTSPFLTLVLLLQKTNLSIQKTSKISLGFRRGNTRSWNLFEKTRMTGLTQKRYLFLAFRRVSNLYFIYRRVRDHKISSQKYLNFQFKIRICRNPIYIY